MVQKMLGVAALLFAMWISTPDTAGEERSIVTFKDGRLSVRAQNRLLGEVLEEISEAASVAIITLGGVADENVSVQFQELPLDDGLRQVLKDHDIFLFYGVEEKGPASLGAVWVYPRGRGRGLQPVPPETWASTMEIEGRLADPDPQVRSRAIQALVERKRDQALDKVRHALKDKDDRVRSHALYGALTAGIRFSADFLRELALHDGSVEVRFLALQGLAEHPEELGAIAAKLAQSDPNPQLRERAQEILQELEAAGQTTAPTEPAKR